MIHPTAPDDTPTLLLIAEGTGVFKPMEIATLREVLDDYHAENQALGHRCVTLSDSGRTVGFAYFAAAPMTEQCWELYWIAIVNDAQARGFGAKLLHAVEEQVRQAGGRVLFIETSSKPHYEKTRRFYLRQNYDREAALRDFYADGDDKVVFRKKLLP